MLTTSNCTQPLLPSPRPTLFSPVSSHGECGAVWPLGRLAGLIESWALACGRSSSRQINTSVKLEPTAARTSHSRQADSRRMLRVPRPMTTVAPRESPESEIPDNDRYCRVWILVFSGCTSRTACMFNFKKICDCDLGIIECIKVYGYAISWRKQDRHLTASHLNGLHTDYRHSAITIYHSILWLSNIIKNSFSDKFPMWLIVWLTNSLYQMWSIE